MTFGGMRIMTRNKDIVIGYTAGVYDLFHIGHLNLLKNAKGMCDKLIVGVTVDELVQYKGKNAMIPFEDRAEIVRSIKYVDAVVPQYDMDKLTMCKKLGATVLFVGDDWYGTEKWQKYEEDFAKEGINVPEMVSKSKGDFAYTIIDADAPATDGIVDALKAIEGVVRVRVVK